MAEQIRYTIERVTNHTYLDETQSVVDGFEVRVRLHEFNEVRTIRVENDHPETIREKMEQVLERRSALEKLG